MNDLVTVLSSYSLPTLSILRGTLRDEGIESFIKDEYIVQSNPLYAAAVGGIKLQVKTEDAARATQILGFLGYIERRPEQEVSAFWARFEKITAKIPGFRRIDIRFRLLWVILLPAIMVISSLYYKNLPSIKDSLLRNNWCVEQITFHGHDVFLRTLGAKNAQNGLQCAEFISFRENGWVQLPGSNTHAIIGNWGMEGYKLSVSVLGLQNALYSGDYAVTLQGTQLQMISANTLIRCTKQ